MELDFEWDAKKAESNLEKHGISFATATAVFDDPNHVEEDTTRPEQGETSKKGSRHGQRGINRYGDLC